MRASAYPKLLPAVVGASLLAAAAPAAAAPVPSTDTTTCGAVAHIGDGLSKDSLKDLESAYEKIGVPADSIHIDGAEGRGALSAKEGVTSGVQAITELVESTETEPPIPGGRCWVIAVGSDGLDGEANPDEMVRDVIGAVPHDERVMWINVDGDSDPVKSFNDALVAMEGEYAQTRVADWAGADGGSDPAKFGAFAAAELLDMTRAGAVDPEPAFGYKSPDPAPTKDDAPNPPTSEPAKDDAPNPPTSEPAKDDAPNPPTSEPTKDDAPNPPTSEPAKDDAPNPPTSEPAKDDAPNPPAPATAPKAPEGPPAPNPGTEAPATGDLQKSFDEMQKSVNGTLGIAIAPVDGDATSFGKLTNDVAWSTSKVPVAIAALRDGSGSEDNVAAAITKSDNDAAKALWSGLGGDAAQKAGAVLVEGGDKTTKVQDKEVRAGFTPFGQTQWSMADAATFGAGLSKMDDPAATTVKRHMGNIVAGQDYGLGKIPGALYKGGWGPNEAGGYLVRQFGIIDLDGAKFGVAIGVKTSSGGYEEASPALNTAAQWIQDNKDGLTGKGNNTAAPATGAAPDAEVTPVSATAGRDRGQGALSGKTIWIDAGHAAQTRPGETVTDPKTGAVKECYTSGTASADGWKEHTFNWEFTQALKAELESRGAKVELGRDDDTGTYECHDKRVAEENASDADLVISVHADGSSAGNRGFHIIHSDAPTPGSKEAAVAARDSLVEAGFTTSNYLGTDGIDARGDLYGLNNTTKAKILLEMGNMKDPTDLALLKDPEQRKKMASAIADSLAA